MARPGFAGTTGITPELFARIQDRASTSTRAALLFAAIFVGLPAVALAQRADLSFPVTNGEVSAMAISGQTLYIGGDFTSIGAYTGGGVPVDSVSAAARPGFPLINGAV